MPHECAICVPLLGAKEYLDRWLETAVKPRVRQKTCQDYDGILRRYIRPGLGDRVLVSMRPMDISNHLPPNDRARVVAADGPVHTCGIRVCAAAGIAMGGRPVGPMDVDLRWVGGIMYRNAEIEETGLAAGVLGHPALGVAWLANKIGPHGHALEPGHIVLAGSFTRVVFAQKGDTLHADFGSLGGIAIQFV